jgi:hypothetical protein
MSRDAEVTTPAWKHLYIAGGFAPLVALLFYLAELAAVILGSLAGVPLPASVEGWFSLLLRNELLGLLYLNAPDILAIALLGVMFVALYVVLRPLRPAAMLIAAYFAFLGIAVFVVPRVAMLSLVPLGDRYAAATSDAARSQLAGAGSALESLGAPSPQTAGFLFIAVATLIISAVMLRSNLFARSTAYSGLAAGVLTLVLDLSGVLAPPASAPLLGLAGLMWIVWWVLVSVGLLRLGRRAGEAA